MKALCGLVVALSLGITLGTAPVWAFGPPNPTGSDANNNTAGGANALIDVTSGTDNTAFGFKALGVDNTGIDNTAMGSGALQ